jgi:hypothetical protein
MTCVEFVRAPRSSLINRLRDRTENLEILVRYALGLDLGWRDNRDDAALLTCAARPTGLP